MPHNTPGDAEPLEKGERLRSGVMSWLKEVGTIIAVALVLSFLIKTFLFRAYYIPSGSMENTLELDDRIFINLLVPKPFALERGDIVVFRDTQGWLAPVPEAPAGPFGWAKDAMIFIGLVPDESQQHLVKRVIGLPGDHVSCCDAQGRLTVNGAPLDEPYLFPGARPSDTTFDVVVPEGKIWVMGDHRNNSSDSREHMKMEGGGFISIDDVEGRATVIAWPLNRFTILGNYPDVFREVPDPSPSSAPSETSTTSPAGQ
ncbi:signal peptidase I [Arthrobacter sp. 35W]|uniref:signal peptidase I n=1 Tax=Arthrobacter sp. 35W TaxID=1132441 RepID=UPI00040ABB98|nr:signal peptidase I [Arthrobacter sp. 35W]